MEVAYRTRLTTTLDVTPFLLKQCLPFRGHDESLSSSNKGNFLELIEWYTQRNDEVAKTMNENAPGNNQMKSPIVQKDLTRACAAEVTNVILNDIKDNIFSLMIDECQRTNMGVVLRYVNKHGCVIERFLAIVYVFNTSAISLKRAIDELFAKHKLPLSRLRGQGYDGVSNMRVAKSNRIVSDFFQYVTMIVNITGASCKRKDKFRQFEHDRLVEYLEKGDITSVLKVLENVYDDGTNNDNSGIATSLIDKMKSYEFVFVMHLVLDMMVQEMNNWFSESSTELLHLAELYPGDFSLSDRVILENQLETYIQNVRGEFSMIEDLGSLAKKMVETGKNTIFLLVYHLIELALVLLVATTSVERVFSMMKIIKTDLCNRMEDEWMNDSLVVYIENDIFATIENEQILQYFQ
ncbi:uncharacterized protein LOC122000593 [Zingiber officinale]|uniref:uncharacterized protein LOC122000593 n=1 Tax=Zingiber officinale TaxID=94328 RepID=UPI001C4B5052|nr:uncharacterized protein LOC122000593 [Zingiber officinale]